MATSVVASAAPLPTAVVCDDADVAAWARDLGALVVWEPERGLNRAVEAGVERLGAAGARRVIVAHADLPLARDLVWVGRFAGVTLVPDRRGGGTNAICVPTGAGFTFSYGPGSFARHGAETHRLGLALRVVREPSLAADVDVPPTSASRWRDWLRQRRRHEREPGPARPRPGHRRPPRRRGVRCRRHPGQMGRGRLRDLPPGVHRRVEGLVGPVRRRGHARRHPAGGATGGVAGAGRHRLGGLPRLARRRVGIGPAPALGGLLLDPAAAARRGAGPRPVDALPAPPRPPPRRLPGRRGRRRRPRPALLPRAEGRPPPADGVAAVGGRRARPHRGRLRLPRRQAGRDPEHNSHSAPRCTSATRLRRNRERFRGVIRERANDAGQDHAFRYGERFKLITKV